MANGTQAAAGTGGAATTNGVANAFGADDSENPSIDIEVEGAPDEGDRRSEKVDTQAEEEARSSGWVTEKEWKEQHNGSTKGWKPAEEYVEFRRIMLPLVSKENKELRTQLAAMKAQMDARDAKVAEAEASLKRADLKRQLREARDNGDADAQDRLEDEIIGLRIAEKAKPAAPANQTDPVRKQEVEEFAKKNPWLAANPNSELVKNFAVELKYVIDAGSADSFPDAMEMAKSRLRRLFPEHFKARTSMAETEGEGSTAPRSGKVSWNDVKKEYRDAYDEKYFRDNKGVTKEGILKQMASDPKQYFKGA